MRMNAYFPMSTANPTGQRPWNFVMQGGLGRLPVRRAPVRRRAMGRLGRLGDSTSFLQAGSVLSYSVTWPNFPTIGRSGTAVSQSVKPQLAQQAGINVLSEYDNNSLFSSGGGMTLQVQTTRDYGTAGDVKSILDSVVGAAIGSPGVIGAGFGSTIAVTQAVSTPLSSGSFTAGTAIDPTTGLPVTTSIDPSTGLTILGSAAQSVDPMTWLTQNFTTVAIFLGALVLLPPLIKKL